jgi:predicted nucleic acid-binding protein
MREIAADTAPLNYLVLIKATGILPQLFASVLIPPAVKGRTLKSECTCGCTCRDYESSILAQRCDLEAASGPSASYLDDGECEAISLVLEQPVIPLLMDDRDGTFEARSLSEN